MLKEWSMLELNLNQTFWKKIDNFILLIQSSSILQTSQLDSAEIWASALHSRQEHHNQIILSCEMYTSCEVDFFPLCHLIPCFDLQPDHHSIQSYSCFQTFGENSNW